MKKCIFLVCVIAIGFVLNSCNNFNQTSTNEKVTEHGIESDYPPELIELANQYHFNIDTTKIYDLDIKVFQTIDDYECLAIENADKRYKMYYGQPLYFWSSEMVYDEKIIKDKAYLIGTYHYYTEDNSRKVVPLYCSTKAYQKDKGIIESIKEVQDYNK